MKINVWLDVRCPFCYIEKRNFEIALNKFPDKDKLIIIWNSFELDPYLKTDISLHAFDYWSQIKNIPRSQAQAYGQHIINSAKNSGPGFNFEEMKIANSFNAHRVMQFSKTFGLASEIIDELFKAQFVEGKNIDDPETLIEIGLTVGLNEQKLKIILKSEAFGIEVRQDETKAKNLGIKAVPFFIFNNKSAVSETQSPETFLNALQQGWKDYKKEKPFIFTGGESHYSKEGYN